MTAAANSTILGTLKIGSDAPIAGVCMKDLIGVDVEARKTAAPTPRRSTLPARHAQTRAFRRAARLTLPRWERALTGTKISDQFYQSLNINSLFTIYTK